MILHFPKEFLPSNHRKKITVMLVLSLAGAATYQPAKAEIKTFVRSYTYEAGEADSKLTSRAIALEQAKRELLEELGTYLESYTEVNKYQLTKDQIIVLTAGVVKTSILGEDWNGKQYKLTAKIETDPQKVAEEIGKIRDDRKKAKELEETKAKLDRALQETERLNRELAEAKSDQERKVYREAYRQQTDVLTDRLPSDPLMGRRWWGWATLSLSGGGVYGAFYYKDKADKYYKNYKASTNVDSMNTYKQDVKKADQMTNVFIGASAVCLVTSGILFLSSIHRTSPISRANSENIHLGMAVSPNGGHLTPQLFLVKRF